MQFVCKTAAQNADVSLFELTNQKPDGNTARTLRLQHCTKKKQWLTLPMAVPKNSLL